MLIYFSATQHIIHNSGTRPGVLPSGGSRESISSPTDVILLLLHGRGFRVRGYLVHTRVMRRHCYNNTDTTGVVFTSERPDGRRRVPQGRGVGSAGQRVCVCARTGRTCSIGILEDLSTAENPVSSEREKNIVRRGVFWRITRARTGFSIGQTRAAALYIITVFFILLSLASRGPRTDEKVYTYIIIIIIIVGRNGFFFLPPVVGIYTESHNKRNVIFYNIGEIQMIFIFFFCRLNVEMFVWNNIRDYP